MVSTLDHLVVLARTLDEGAAWVERHLGARPVEGGKHETMGTHNRLLSLGPESYLEVMAIDPQAMAPMRPRWFGLDSRSTRELISRGPALVHWVERTDDLEAIVAAADEPLDILAFNRGPFQWRMGLTRDGGLPGDGTRPTYIQWDSARPAASLPHSGRSVLDLGAPDGEVRIATPSGIRTLPWTRAPGRE
jgi:hypothetical protein